MKKHTVTLVNFIFSSSTNWLPIGSLSLVSSLKKRNFHVDFRDFQLFPLTPVPDMGQLASFFKDTAQILAVSCYSHALPYLLKVLEKIKEEFPEKTIILGGIGPNLVARPLMERFPWVDFIVRRNEYEVLPLLAEAIANGERDFSGIRNIACREDGRVRFTEETRLIQNEQYSIIEELESFDLAPYHVFPVLAATGCLFNCPFCCIPKYVPKYKKRNLEELQEEMLLIRSRMNDRRVFYLLDEGLVTDRDRLEQILSFTGRPLFRNVVDFACDGRIEFMDETMVRDMGRSNFSIILYGVESGSDAIIEKMNKRFTIEEAVETVLYTRKYLDVTTASFIYGFPYESKEEFLETLYHAIFLAAQKIDIHFSLLCPLPGTALFQEYGDELCFDESLISQMTMPFGSAREKAILPVLDIVRKYPDIFPTFYHYNSPDLSFKNSLADSYKPSIQSRHRYDHQRKIEDFK